MPNMKNSYINQISDSALNLPIGFSSLGKELAKIESVAGKEMPEAVAFYAGRIVESLSQRALLQSNLRHGISLEINLNLLSQWGKIDQGTFAIGNMIRRISNQARHMDRAIDTYEEPTIIGLLQLWVEWFLENFSTERKGSIDSGIGAADWSNRTPFIRTLVRGDVKEMELSLAAHKFDQIFQADPTLACFTGERLIDSKSALANDFTKKIKVIFPKSQRVTQIRALYFSRNSNPHQAVYLLKSLTGLTRVDAETFGILGGAYKNIWADSHDHQYLQRSYEQYEKGVHSSPDDYYLRINLAATALWLGDRDTSRAQSNKVLQVLAKFGVAVDDKNQITPSYWALATIAEANFLAEKYAKAVTLYEQLAKLDSSGGRWIRTAQQLKVHLEKLKDDNVRETFAAILNT